MITALLDWIAHAYFWFYHHLLQRPADEPITRQASRIVQRWPWLCWGVALLVLGLTAGLLRGWWLLLTAAVYLFSLWWFDHILAYSVKHRDDNPIYYATSTVAKVERWAGRRLEHRRLRRERKQSASGTEAS